MNIDDIPTGAPVFAREGDVNIGAVRGHDGDALLIHFENHGEVRLTPDQIASHHDGKVMLNLAMLPADLADAIGHAHDGEMPVGKMPPL
ncbi:hypothetical protein ACK8OR_11850 [Jannaschia sp. KMU-145]|uniref:hypothetical protein n=1 Tax=Jannaschia halovivens TaxID=3388667 RepID=UPI00396B4842